MQTSQWVHLFGDLIKLCTIIYVALNFNYSYTLPGDDMQDVGLKGHVQFEDVIHPSTENNWTTRQA